MLIIEHGTSHTNPRNVVLLEKGYSEAIECYSHDRVMWFFKGFSRNSEYQKISSQNILVLQKLERAGGIYSCYGVDKVARPFIQTVEVLVFGKVICELKCAFQLPNGQTFLIL